MRGHLYCSIRCAREDGRGEFWRPVRKTLARPVPPRLALLAIALGVSAPMVLTLRTVRELDRLSRVAVAYRPRRPPPRIESVEETAGGTRIAGPAPAGGAVFLFADAGLVGAAPVVGGRFRFEGVRQSGPYRIGVLPLSPEVPAAPPPAPRSQAATARTPAASPVPGAAALPRVAAAAAPTLRSAPAPIPTPAPIRVAALATAPPRRIERPAPVPTALPAAAPPRAAPVAAAAPAFAARAIVAPGPPAIASAVSVPDLTRGPSDRPDLVLSFDAGSSDRGAREILDALESRGIRTSIFLTGDFIRRNPELAARIAEDGHEVGNHTDTHPHLTTYAQDGRQTTRPGVDRAFVSRQLRATAEAYRRATGRDLAPLWRAPYGEHNAEIRRWAALEGYWHVGWTGGRAGLDGMDWVSDPSSRAYRSAGRVVERLTEHAENGGIILLHLGSDREDPVAPRVAELIDGLGRRGFRLVPASRFLAAMGLTEERLLALRVPRSVSFR
jgi:peptidoglycan/xylan/chitin deacetylase (PgdA/CDA1 family)